MGGIDQILLSTTHPRIVSLCCLEKHNDAVGTTSDRNESLAPSVPSTNGGERVSYCKVDLVCAHKHPTASSRFAGSRWPVSMAHDIPKLDLEVFRADIPLENHPLPRSIGPGSVRRRHTTPTKDIWGSVLCTLVGTTSFIGVKG